LFPVYFFQFFSVDILVLLIVLFIGVGIRKFERAALYAIAASVIVPLLVAYMEWPLIDSFGPHTIGQRRQQFVIAYFIDPQVKAQQLLLLALRIVTTAAAALGLVKLLNMLQVYLVNRDAQRVTRDWRAMKIARYVLWAIWIGVLGWRMLNHDQKDSAAVSAGFLFVLLLAILVGMMERKLRKASIVTAAPV
jgi:hypothetical protein